MAIIETMLDAYGDRGIKRLGCIRWKFFGRID